MINEHYKKATDSTAKNFVNFIKINARCLQEHDVKEIEFLSQRIANNMFYFEDNIDTAKSDYVLLLGILIKNGVIFQEFKDMEPTPNYQD